MVEAVSIFGMVEAVSIFGRSLREAVAWNEQPDRPDLVDRAGLPSRAGLALAALPEADVAVGCEQLNGWVQGIGGREAGVRLKVLVGLPAPELCPPLAPLPYRLLATRTRCGW